MPFSADGIEAPETAQLYARRLVLVRPDGHVCWRPDDPPTDADHLIAQVTGAL